MHTNEGSSPFSRFGKPVNAGFLRSGFEPLSHAPSLGGCGVRVSHGQETVARAPDRLANPMALGGVGRDGQALRHRGFSEPRGPGVEPPGVATVCSREPSWFSGCEDGPSTGEMPLGDGHSTDVAPKALTCA